MSEMQRLHDPDEAKAANRSKLARMAGQIAAFFEAYPEDEAARSVATHINDFWSRRMRADFLAAFTADSQELSPLLRRAFPLIRPAKGE